LSNTVPFNYNTVAAAISEILYDKPYEQPKRSGTVLLSKLIEEKGIDKAVTEFKKIKADDEYSIRESEINQLGYTLLGAGKLEEAIGVFKLNVELFPDSWNVYDSLGEAYMNNGDTKLAIDNYKKSLELNPDNPTGIEALKKLEGK
jgi:tetratricopeptide (TPR) repeat protein